MIKITSLILILSMSVTINGCSNKESIKDWLKEGTKEYQEESKEAAKASKKGIKNLLKKRGCISGSSAKIVETKDTNYTVYEVTCVKKSNRLIVKCDENSCSE